MPRSIPVIVVWLLCAFIPMGLHTQESGSYTVFFEGIENENSLNLLRAASQSVKLQSHPPKSEASLKRRVEADIPNLIKVLHSEAYYNARIDYTIDFNQQPYEVFYQIDLGPVYPIESVEILPDSLEIKPQMIGIKLGSPAYPSTILASEECLIKWMHRMGYPLAKMSRREVIADQTSKTIHIKLHTDPGPRALFGPTSIFGNNRVKADFIRGKIQWEAGKVYDPALVESTMAALESTGVFSSIVITHSEEVDGNGMLPMTIQLSEGKQRTVGFGIGYSTQRGPGFTGSWENRNYRGRGDQLSVNANVLQDTQDGSITYSIPDFITLGQDLHYSLDIEHNDTKGFEMTSVSLSAVLERQLSEKIRISFGGMYEYLKSTEESKDGDKTTETFNLARLPAKLRWTTVDDPLDPSKGATVFLKAIPSLQAVEDPLIYTITSLTASFYKPFSREKRFILAGKAMFSSIWGAPLHEIPGSDRLYAGSENTLRGYDYYTVSPLSEDGDPIGGRSLMIYTLEGRWKLTKQWGTVLFYDVGNVYSDPTPEFNSKLLQSIGLGLRYYTPVGPLRLDTAVPLNRRKFRDEKTGKKKYIDSPYQIYFSVGQSF